MSGQTRSNITAGAAPGSTASVRVLGVDPGLSGGLALLDRDTGLVDAVAFPLHVVNKKTRIDGARLAAIVELFSPSVAFVEAVAGRPRQAGQFQFGVNAGLVHGVLHALGVPFELVSPTVWKAAFGIRRTQDETKADKKTEARRVASVAFPSHAERFKRVKDDGVAEAALLALYGLKKLHVKARS